MPATLQDKLRHSRFVITAEITPPVSADRGELLAKAAALKGLADAVNVTDAAGARPHLGAVTSAALLVEQGIEPVLQLTCRDRNRIALQSDLLSAAAMGIPNVLLMTGDHPRFGDHADAKGVFDLDGTALLRVARAMRDERKLMSGRQLDPAPCWLLGAVASPAGPAEASVARLAAKVAAGAQFVQTQFAFDVPEFTAWLAR